jgi:hypothetical protein
MCVLLHGGSGSKREKRRELRHYHFFSLARGSAKEPLASLEAQLKRDALFVPSILGLRRG